MPNNESGSLCISTALRFKALARNLHKGGKVWHCVVDDGLNQEPPPWSGATPDVGGSNPSFTTAHKESFGQKLSPQNGKAWWGWNPHPLPTPMQFQG